MASRDLHGYTYGYALPTFTSFSRPSMNLSILEMFTENKISREPLVCA